jgi:hypothetical protein
MKTEKVLKFIALPSSFPSGGFFMPKAKHKTARRKKIVNIISIRTSKVYGASGPHRCLFIMEAEIFCAFIIHKMGKQGKL